MVLTNIILSFAESLVLSRLGENTANIAVRGDLPYPDKTEAIFPREVDTFIFISPKKV